MIVAFLSVNSQFTVFFPLSTYQSKKFFFIPIFKTWPVNTPDSFFQSFQPYHFP